MCSQCPILAGMRQRFRPRSRLSSRQWRVFAVKTLVCVAVWLLFAVPASFVIFVNSDRATVVASHDAVVSPTLDGYATLNLGPFLPNLRLPTNYPLGAQIDLGKTTVLSYDELVSRYAFIGSQPEGQIAKIRSTLVEMAYAAALTGALLGALPIGLWFLLGRRRRDELFHHVTWRRVWVTVLVGTVGAVVVIQPWSTTEEQIEEEVAWLPIETALSEVPIPPEAQSIEIQSGLMTSGTKRLAVSAFDTYNRSLRFYRQVEEDARALSSQLRQPAEDETVAIVVSDRHDNVGMDSVARTIAEEGGATMILNAGDDTSTGQPWEAFSLDSIQAAFEDFDEKYTVAGNHDHGDFVVDYYDKAGWTTFTGEAVDASGDVRILGANDPRASGLGSWRDETGLSFDEHRELVADTACENDEAGNRISTLLVHDANSGREALERGCVDLVIGGHVHAQLGPTEVVGANGAVGYTYTNGTTGGAAYALAIGSKLRRDAQVSLVTYRGGVPVGIQPVTIRTVGDFQVGDYIELDVERPEAAETEEETDPDTGETDTGETDTGETDTGETDTGETDTGETDTGETDTGDAGGADGPSPNPSPAESTP
jgi:predicted phosphodiesterase